MSAGTATLKFMREEKLTEHEQHLGALLFRHLKQLQAEFSWVGDVRGRGLIVELGGRRGATVRFLPPLTITECEVKHVAQILYLSATSLNSGYSSE